MKKNCDPNYTKKSQRHTPRVPLQKRISSFDRLPPPANTLVRLILEIQIHM